jgi:hypothetical protein
MGICCSLKSDRSGDDDLDQRRPARAQRGRERARERLLPEAAAQATIAAYGDALSRPGSAAAS